MQHSYSILILHIFGVTVENLPYFARHELRSFHPAQEEALCISALMVWRINTCSLVGSPVPFHYIKWYKSISNILKNAPLLKCCLLIPPVVKGVHN